MKNTDRKISALILSAFFLFDTACLRFVLMNMTASQSPVLVLFEVFWLLVAGWGVVKAWQVQEPWTTVQKRTMLALLGLYLVVNLLCMPLEAQIVSASLSTINQWLSQNTVLVWLLIAVKLILPGVAIWFACRSRKTSTVVFEEPAEPQEFATDEALEQLTIRLDEKEVEE
ncbi:membrane protein [gut metagenome]|uniref:Membrane protein n=1 Tax=gut metagenome TaxID=749906 RepID=J9D3B2_9ZZZZ